MSRVFSFIPLKLRKKEKIYQMIYSSIILILIFGSFIVLKYYKFSVLAFNSGLLMTIFSTIVNVIRWKKWFKLEAMSEWYFQNELNESPKFIWSSKCSPVYCIILFLSLQLYGYLSNDEVEILLIPICLMDCIAKYLPIILLDILKKRFELVNKYSKNSLCRNDMVIVQGRIFTVKKVIRCKKVYENLFNMSVCFNKLFGWVIFIFYGEQIVSIFNVLQYLVNSGLQVDIDIHRLIYYGLICCFKFVSSIFNRLYL